MEVLILTVFVSVILVAVELFFFAWNVRHGTHDHSDRLSLLPLEQDLPQLTERADRRHEESD